jgi:azurin
MSTLKGSLLVMAVVLSLGCSKDEPKKAAAATIDPPVPTQTTPSAPPPAPEPPKKAAQHVELEIASVANTMAFDKTALTVPAGAEVHLTFKNHSTMTTLPHNWVLVKPGTEASVAAAGLKLGEQAGYLDVRVKDILAVVPMAKPGESSEATFNAPDEAGKYPYICTIPGHYMMMKGVLTVTP